jgi:hypothetical protein
MTTHSVVPYRLFKSARLDRHFEDRCCGHEMTSDEIRLVQAYRACSECDQQVLNELATRWSLTRRLRALPADNIGKPVITIDPDDREGA